MKRSALRTSARTRRKQSPQREAKTLCRKIVVELRDRNTCQRCGATSETHQIHWAHVKNRGARSLVCVPWASLALCAGCHFWFDGNKGSALEPGPGLRWWMAKFPSRANSLLYWQSHRRKPIHWPTEVLWLTNEVARLECQSRWENDEPRPAD